MIGIKNTAANLEEITKPVLDLPPELIKLAEQFEVEKEIIKKEKSENKSLQLDWFQLKENAEPPIEEDFKGKIVMPDGNGVLWFLKPFGKEFVVSLVKKYYNYENMARAISNLQYNDFSHFPERIKENGEITQVDDPYISELYRCVSTLYTDIPNKDLPHLINNLSRENRYHPVKNMIESSAWDDAPRAVNLFIDYLGADNNDYVRWVTTKWLVGAVKRIYEPGCKFEIVPILQGKQGIGKSTIASKLGGEWFTDSLKGMGKTKDDYQTIIGSWIVELGELASMSSTETETTKNFISAKEDKVRLPYDRYPQSYKRTVAFIGTSNPAQYLTDFTGNRRFFPIPLNNKCKNSVFEMDESTIQQIWAEAYQLYLKGIKPFVDKTDVLDVEMDAIANQYRQEATEVGADMQAIEDYLAMPVPNAWNKKLLQEKRAYYENYINNQVFGTCEMDRTTSSEILKVVLDIQNNDRHISSATKKVNIFMDSQSEWKKQAVWINGKTTKGYKRV